MGRAKFSPDLNEFQKMAQSNTLSQLESFYHKERHCISKFAKDNGIVIFSPCHFLNDEQKAYCIQHFLDKTSYQLANKFGVSQATVYRAWKEAGLRGMKPAKRTYPFNQDYFETIDSQDKAYWLGFLASDGNVYLPHKNGQAHISLSLNVLDAEILQFFAEDIDTQKPVKKSERVASLVVTSDKMAEDLGKHGVFPRKTYSMSFPPAEVPVDFIPHYLRGYFDGDGTISKKIDRQRPSHVYIGYAGFCDHLEQIRSFMEASYGIKSSVRQDKRNNKYSTNNPFGELILTNKYSRTSFLNMIYKDARRFLPRKKELADEYLEAVLLNPKHDFKTVPSNAVFE